MIRRCGAATAAVLFLTAGAAAQSISSVRGPGYPVLQADARTSVLGGLGIGLRGLAVSPIDPAAVGRAAQRGAVVVVEAVERGVEVGDATDRVGTTRFPLIRVIYPVRRVVLSAGYGGYLDQSWGLIREGEQTLEDTPVPFTDVMRSTGGVGQLHLGAAMPLGERLALGLLVGAHTGSQQVDFNRTFDGTTPAGVFDPYRETLSWRYSAPMAALGLSWDPVDLARVAASVTWAGTLVGEPVDGRATRREVALPLQVAGGASAYLVPGLMATVSGRWSEWSGTDPRVGVPIAGFSPASRDTWEVGGGLEWVSPSPTSRRAYPIRVGVQYRELPFPFVDEAPTEWFAGAGVGMRIGLDPANPLAMADLTVQRGHRTAPGGAGVGDLTESMWRFSLSLSLFGH